MNEMKKAIFPGVESGRLKKMILFKILIAEVPSLKHWNRALNSY